MFNGLKKFFNNFKEYIVLIFLLLVSLSLLPLNKSAELKKIRTLAFGNLVFLNSLVLNAQNMFKDKDEIVKLENLNSELMLKVNQLREYGLENSELKRILRLKDTTKYPIRPVTIISKLISSLPGYYLINAGLNDSLKNGMPVINDKGLVGLIVKASDHFSLIMSLKSSGSHIAVMDQRSKVNGILDWDGKGFVIKNISTTNDISIGDRIVTSAFSTIVPPSIPVGIVIGKSTSVAGLLTNIEVKTFVDFQSVKNVVVLKIINSKEVNNIELNLLKEITSK